LSSEYFTAELARLQYSYLFLSLCESKTSVDETASHSGRQMTWLQTLPRIYLLATMCVSSSVCLCVCVCLGYPTAVCWITRCLRSLFCLLRCFSVTQCDNFLPCLFFKQLS